MGLRRWRDQHGAEIHPRVFQDRIYKVGFVASGPGRSDTAASSESITVKPGPLVKVSIDPEAVTLQVQETARSQARAFDQFDNPIGDAVLSWILIGVGGLSTRQG